MKKVLLNLTVLGLMACDGGNVLNNSKNSSVDGVFNVKQEGEGSSKLLKIDEPTVPVILDTASSYLISGLCNSKLGFVSVSVSGMPQASYAACVNGRFQAQMNLSSLEAPHLSIRAAQGVLESEISRGPVVDMQSPLLEVDGAIAPVSLLNQENYNLSGSCSEEGEPVYLSLSDAGLQETVLCQGERWVFRNLDLTSLSEGSHELSIEHRDAAGNSTRIAEMSLNKDLSPLLLKATSVRSINGSDLNQNTKAPLVWSSESHSSLFFDIPTSAPHQIQILRQGSYRLSFTLPVRSSAQRPNILAQVEVNGELVSGGASASSYMRNYDNHDSSSDHIDLVLDDLNAGDVIEVTVQRASASGLVEVDEEAQLFIEPLLHETVIVAESDQLFTGSNLNASSFIPLLWDVVYSGLVTSFSVAQTSSQDSLSIARSGSYFLSFNLPVSSNNSRTSVVAQVYVDGEAVEGAVARQGYMRNDSGHNSASLHWQGLLENLSQGQEIEVRVRRDGAGGTVSFLNGHAAHLSLERVSSDNYISLRGEETVNGSNFNQSSSVLWDEETFKNEDHFSHSISEDSDAIVIQSEGNYFVSYSDSLYTRTQRGAPQIDVTINGASTGLLCNSHYVRSSSGHHRSSCSLSGLLLDLEVGDVLRFETSREARSGTVTAQDAARAFILKK